MPQAPQERPNVVVPEGVVAQVPERVVMTEAVPAGSPGSAPPPQVAAAASKLTAADVAAAIAAVPGPAPVAPTSGTPVPGSAADADLIEPEWVAKAEEVVAAHQGDPYGEEEAIEELQQDYLQKRYGLNVADPDQEKQAK